MNSSVQINNTSMSAKGPTTTPLVTSGPGKRQLRLTPDQEQAITEAIRQFYLRIDARPNVHAYRIYRTRCAQTNTHSVTLRTFYRRLRHHVRHLGLSPFMAVAQIDETIIDLPVLGGESS